MPKAACGMLVDPARKILHWQQTLFWWRSIVRWLEVIDNTTSRGRTLRFYTWWQLWGVQKVLSPSWANPLIEIHKTCRTARRRWSLPNGLRKNEGAVCCATRQGCILAVNYWNAPEIQARQLCSAYTSHWFVEPSARLRWKILPQHKTESDRGADTWRHLQNC